jgi:hypothetical protein
MAPIWTAVGRFGVFVQFVIYISITRIKWSGSVGHCCLECAMEAGLVNMHHWGPCL